MDDRYEGSCLVSGCEERNSVEITSCAVGWTFIGRSVCKIQRNGIISIKDNVNRRSSYLLTCLLHATHSSHIHIVWTIHIILYYVEMIMRLIPPNFYFSFFSLSLSPFFLFKFCTPADVPASGIFTRYFEFISVILLSLQGSAKRCFGWLLLDLRFILVFFFSIFFFFNFILRIGTWPHRADIRFNDT